MKILLDSNIAIDAVLKREPFYISAEKVIGLSQGGIGLFISASAITDIYYIVSKSTGNKKTAMTLIKDLLENIDIAAVTGNEIRQAISLDWGDFEDAVQYAAGEAIAVDYIVTRNKSDFISAILPVVSPDELLALLIPPDKKVEI
jgi:predicted nucleic-acid-binding protein